MVLGRLSIRQRILIVFLLIVLSSGMVQLWIAGRQLEAMTLEFYQHHLETDALLISANLAEPMEHYLDGEGTTDLNRSLNMMIREVKHDYRLLDANYNVIGYSAAEGLGSILQVAETPELAEARQNRIGADIRLNPFGIPYMHLAVGVVYEGRTVGFLVLSQPMRPAYADVQSRWLELGTATLPVIFLVIVGSLWIARSILNPINALNQSAMRMASGTLDTRIATPTDDEIGRLARTFNYMAEQLETLIKTQRNFISNAAHELRTPLMTLKLRAEALDEDQLPLQERSAYLQEIHQEIDHMAGMVSSLLVLARVDDGRIDNTGTDPLPALHDLTRNWRITAEQAGLRFESDISPVLPTVLVSANEFRLMIDNLLNNAVKYTSSGWVCLRAWQEGEGLLIRVEDSGIGFNQEQAKHLFERFYRVDEVRAQVAGTGLGLSIVQAIASRHGGQITAESAGIGRGAAFTLRLPAVPSL